MGWYVCTHERKQQHMVCVAVGLGAVVIVMWSEGQLCGVDYFLSRLQKIQGLNSDLSVGPSGQSGKEFSIL